MSSPDPFAVFQDERFRVTEKEWQLARKCLLEIAPQSFKLPRANKDEREYRARKARYGQENFRKRLEELYEKDVLAELYEHLKHSFININGKLLALLPHTPGIGEDPAIAGAGSYAKVKYAIDEKGNEYVVKIEHKGVKAAQDEELSFMQEVGWAADTAVRVLPNGQNQRYTVMPYLGKTLLNSVTRADVSTQDPTNLDSAIKLAWQVHCAHQGWLSNKGRVIAHRDLKPDNCTRDKNGRVHLIDWGFAQRGGDLDSPSHDEKGSQRWQPPLSQKYTHRQLDVIALQKTLYLPRILYDMARPNGGPRKDRHTCLLTDKFIEDNGLQDLMGKNPPSFEDAPTSPSLIAATLALTSLELSPEASSTLQDSLNDSIDKQQALMVLFFGGILQAKKEELTTILSNEPLVTELSNLAPIVEKLPQPLVEHLSERVLNNQTEDSELFKLSKSVALVPSIRGEFCSFVGKCWNDSNSNVSYDEFKRQIILNPKGVSPSFATFLLKEDPELLSGLDLVGRIGFLKSIILSEANSEAYEGLTKWTSHSRADGLRRLSKLDESSTLEDLKSILIEKKPKSSSPRFFSVERRRDPKVQAFYTQALNLIEQFESSYRNQQDLQR